jgi:predicted secreted Zn-dependent protease
MIPRFFKYKNKDCTITEIANDPDCKKTRSQLAHALLNRGKSVEDALKPISIVVGDRFEHWTVESL